jgi:hypothetical protein
MELTTPLLGFLKAFVPPALTWLLPKVCGVKIEEPPDGDEVHEQSIVVKGGYRWTFGFRFALLRQQGKKYWPQGSPTFDPKHKTWEGKVSIGGNVGEKYTIVVAAVSEDLKQLLNYYGQVHDETGKWVPITLYTRPKGLTELDRAVVTRAGKK